MACQVWLESKESSVTDQAPMDTVVRQEFSFGTRDQIAKRAGFICSFPDCRGMTVAGSADRKSGLTLTGVAAHITAASEGGPRYDAAMSADERTSETNGLWLCQVHAKFVDDNPTVCTVENLRRWKIQHERWVFDRVESGRDLFCHGVTRFALHDFAIFKGEHQVSLGRHNILVGDNESGKSTFCEAYAAFSGVPNWEAFERKLTYKESRARRSSISATYQDERRKTTIQIGRQLVHEGSGAEEEEPLRRMHIELDGLPSPDWPKSLFRAIYFGDQFMRGRDTENFESGLHYLARVFALSEDVVWDSIRDEFFATSHFGHRFKRRSRRQIDILEPDLTFYLPYQNLATSQIQLVYLDIALKLLQAAAPQGHWTLIFDTSFFERFDRDNKKRIFTTLVGLADASWQTIFCLNTAEDAEFLRSLEPERWIGATRIQELTLHAFL
jgi:hypothetical protein